jgi:hypothetical protein
MNSTHVILTAAAIATAIAHAQGPQFTVIPPSYATADALGQLWVPGASKALRQQQIIGASLLQGLVGQTLTALEFRRNAQADDFQAGSLNLTVTLSITPNEPLSTSSTFANNIGPAPITVFTGQLQLPASPGTTSPDWTAPNILRIPFQTSFNYQGGNLCIDIVGSPLTGQEAGWWPCDADQSPVTSTVVDLGGGCGTYGGPQHRWSTAVPRTLVPGGEGSFFAFGPLGSFGLIAFATEFPGGWPLAIVLPAAPLNCTLYINLPIALSLVMFVDNAPADPRADYIVPIPNISNIIGSTLTTQWVEWTQQVSSNALTWTIGNAPSIQMAHVDGYATDLTGELFVDLAHVVRFEH